jgi:alanyl-tRNA synthetase
LAKKLLELEERKFRETLENGIKYLNEALSKDVVSNVLSGAAAFKLYDTYGFPLDLTEMYLADKNIKLDQAGFDKAMHEQKELSKKSWKGAMDNSDKVFHALKEKCGATKFTGYENFNTSAKLLAVENFGEMKALIFDTTTFYGESGGQVGDIGTVQIGDNIIAHIYDTQKPVDDFFVHLSSDSDALVVGETYNLVVDEHNRKLSMRNHSATHLLQAALIKILGPHVKQAGSLVTPEKLRFDFTHLQALSKKELENVENLVNQEIQKGLAVSAKTMNMKEASNTGAMALFGEKYGDLVRVLTMGKFSTELCGGTHVHNTQEIGLISILSESSLAAGVRRIEATTSQNAINYLSHRSKLLKQVESYFNDKEDGAIQKVFGSFKDLKEKQKEIETLKDKIQAIEARDLFKNIEVINGIDTAVLETTADNDLRKLSDLFIGKFPNGAVVLYSVAGDKVQVLVRAGKCANTLNAGDTLKEILLVVNGRGGGKIDLAQGSGDASMVSKIKDHASQIIKRRLE